ncbi:MAG: hypothetical protein KKE86_06845, partial [Planctomycetes bacterium]|nr:hypothetical protein [Planctomycetota bacterium]
MRRHALRSRRGSGDGMFARRPTQHGKTQRWRRVTVNRHPARPGLSLAGVRLEVTRLHRWGFPVLLVVSSSTHAVADQRCASVPAPVGPVGCRRSSRPTSGGLPCYS